MERESTRPARTRTLPPLLLSPPVLLAAHGTSNTILSGRTATIHKEQPCVAAQLRFLDGAMCQTARYVKDIDADSAASCAEFNTPFMQMPMGETETLVHEVQKISLAQASPVCLSQLITFHAIDCPFNKSKSSADCYGAGAGTIQLTHNGKTSPPIALATATPADIAYAFERLHSTLYSGVTATILHATSEEVVWRLELVTPWAACTDHQESVRRRMPSRPHTHTLSSYTHITHISHTLTQPHAHSCTRTRTQAGLPPCALTPFFPRRATAFA